MDPRNFVVQLDSTFTCVICHCDMTRFPDAYSHLYGFTHMNAMKKYGEHLWHEEGNRYYCHLCFCWISGYHNVFQHLKGSQHQDLLYGSDYESSYGSSVDEEEEEPDPGSFVVKIDSKPLCILCNYSSWDKISMDYHVGSYKHKDAVRDYGYDIILHDYGSADCSLCKCAISGYANVYRHIMGQRHQDSLMDFSD